MSAALLREAADRLDALADAATPGPWLADQGASGNWWVERPHAADIAPEVETAGDATYIAAMSPTVGKALAAWLRQVADWSDLTGIPIGGEALAVAHAILGGAA